MFTFPTTLLNAPASGGAPWTPADITTAAWYDATTGVSDTAGAVDTWNDQSGNGHHLTQTSTNRPTTNSVTLNGLNVIDFDGSDDYMLNTDNIGTGVFSFAAVYSRDVASVDHSIFDGVSADRLLLRLRSSNVLAIYAGTGFVGSDSISTGPAMASGLFNGSSSEIRLNGGTAVTGDPGAGTSELASGITIGASSGVSQEFNGAIAEIVITPGSLSTSDRQKLEGYLAWTWGQEGLLPGGHPYKSAPPTV
jgi:hypothetical protein